MQVSTILDHIDSGHMALPTFQRGFVWNGKQVRELMDSLYRRHPVGSLLVWVTTAGAAATRGAQEPSPGTVRLLLDGQQRMTSLYGIIRGKPPAFLDGDARAFTGLHFHLQNEEFRFHQPSVMNDDPLWIDVSALMQQGDDGVGEHIARLTQAEIPQTDIGDLYGRISRLLGIRTIEFHADEVTGADKTVDVVVDIFNRVNSGGTKLSQGDLALAKIGGSWPEARSAMKDRLAKWKGSGYGFSLDWLLRNLNAIVTGEARFAHLHDKSTQDIQDGLERAEHAIDYALNLIADQLGLDHNRVLFGRNALPVMSRYIDQRGGKIADGVERDRLLYWYFQSAMWGRFSGSTESALDQDFEVIEELDGGLGRLIEQLRLWHGGLRIEPAHFRGWGIGARFYPVLYALTRVGEARDWSDPWPVLKKHLLGKMSVLEVHHIFPKARLYQARYTRSEVNAVANFCFLTKETNGKIGARLPSDYFREIRDNCPGALESQWIPMDEELWEIENYPRFLEARRKLLAGAANALLDSLRHGTTPEAEVAPVSQPVADASADIEDADEEEILVGVREWVSEQGLAEGQVGYELAHPETREPLAVLDLAWPDGLQEELTEPVALLLDEEAATLQIANDHGFRHFTSADAFKRYVETDVLALDET